MSDSCIRHIENYWKAKTSASNDVFNKGHFKDALLGYKNALYRAEVLHNNFIDCVRVGIPFIQVYIISCNNIAKTYEELQQYEKAESMLKQVVSYLIHLERNTIFNSDKIQSELQKATLAYISFIKKNNVKNLKQELLLRALKERFVTN